MTSSQLTQVNAKTLGHKLKDIVRDVNRSRSCVIVNAGGQARPLRRRQVRPLLSADLVGPVQVRHYVMLLMLVDFIGPVQVRHYVMPLMSVEFLAPVQVRHYAMPLMSVEFLAPKC